MNASGPTSTLAFVLSADRSGVGLTLEVLQALGASLGPLLPDVSGSRDSGDELSVSDELMERLRYSVEIWNPSALPGETLRSGRRLLSTFTAASEGVVVVSDSRFPLIWPLWRGVLEERNDIRTVLLYVVRPPHQAAMTANLRSGGDFPYDVALDRYETELRRIAQIRDEWAGESAVIRLGTEKFVPDLASASIVCGLPWSDEIAEQFLRRVAELRPTPRIEHGAQRMFDELAGDLSRLDSRENERALERDAGLRDLTLRQKLVEWRDEHAALARELGERKSAADADAAAQIVALLDELRRLRDDVE